ncbi:uncharacterized protein [Rutidosis leptorrhynchoides]|uniref:uncharacterized protein n=1 Tax=Rutidosis leptorrhynchoides TaxID=125765 RepID=UPI003A992E4B
MALGKVILLSYPAIRAYTMCVPIICIDGTHLKGSYNGKLLLAVAKNANNQVLPIAFSIVDNETNASWTWFLEMFQQHVVQNRKICVISDRHSGILHAMGICTSQYGWEHRYCLRHIRSNLMKRYPRNAIRAIKRASPAGWKYLKDSDVRMWTVYKDHERSRWGNTTTNIAECVNNVMNHARMMPIKACIEYTFDYTIKHFVDQYREAYYWDSPLTKKMWKIYHERELKSQTYRTTCYDAQRGLFKVQSTYQRSGEGGTDYNVEFAAKKCTCGRWQHQRLPCSHAISVCSHLQENASGMASKLYTTTVWREQYNQSENSFNPLRDKSYWAPGDWQIEADATRIIKHKGRKKTKRIRNQMDERERHKPKCGICRTEGHNKNTCPLRN